MRLDNTLSTMIYKTINEARKVSKLNINQTDIDDLCFTINVINGLAYGKSIMEDNLISEYQIPNIFSKLIVPVRIKYSTDEYARDFKAVEYSQQAMTSKGRKLLTPSQFKLVWLAIQGALRMKSDFKDVSGLRVDGVVSTLDKALMKIGTTVCMDNGAYVPYLVQEMFYRDINYTMNYVKVFEKWLLDVIVSTSI